MQSEGEIFLCEVDPVHLDIIFLCRLYPLVLKTHHCSAAAFQKHAKLGGFIKTRFQITKVQEEVRSDYRNCTILQKLHVTIYNSPTFQVHLI